MRRLLTAALLVAAAVAPTVIAQDAKKANLYPLVKGTKWVYQMTAGDKKTEATYEVTKSETKDGKTSASLEAKVEGQTISEQVSADDKAVYRNGFQGQALENPLPILKYPPKAGDTWTEKLKIADQEMKATFTVKEFAEVQVPAGKYKTVPVEGTVEVMGQKITTTQWYAEGVGMVKQKMEIGPTSLTLELTKYTPAK